MFTKYWSDNEKLYSYIWGMETIHSRENYRDEFIADGEEQFMFDQKRPYQSKFKKVFKIIVASIISFLIVIYL